MIHQFCRENLNQIKQMLAQMSDSAYAAKNTNLFGASIGEHTRHVIEFYSCLLAGQENCTVNYDTRARNLLLEVSTQAAIQSIDKIYDSLAKNPSDYPLTLLGNYSTNQATETSLQSSFHRELAYCLEHSIHHQALIKIGLAAQNLTYLIDDNFGVAPATIRHKACAQ